jgi:hypothetical protein
MFNRRVNGRFPFFPVGRDANFSGRAITRPSATNGSEVRRLIDNG